MSGRSREPDRIIRIKEAAHMLAVSPCTIRRVVGRGELRMIRITPARVGFRLSELERYISAREKMA